MMKDCIIQAIKFVFYSLTAEIHLLGFDLGLLSRTSLLNLFRFITFIIHHLLIKGDEPEYSQNYYETQTSAECTVKW
jgi:hypothetical protein